uniref:Uncharacterized protein n=1 Tax=Gadus morhua TaxID=8049 RepID=A0A8C5CWW2_GADMO
QGSRGGGGDEGYTESVSQAAVGGTSHPAHHHPGAAERQGSRFSPVNETQIHSVSNSCALEDLLDLTGTAAYSRLTSESHEGGDLNKNLIQGVVSPMADNTFL